MLFPKQICAMLHVALALTAGSAPLAWTYTTGNYSWAVAVSQDGRYVIAGSDDMHTYFFDASSADGKPRWSHAARGYVRHVAISSNGACAAAGDFDGNVFFFRPGDLGDPAWSLRADSSIYALSMSDDCAYLTAGDQEGTVYLFRTGQSTPVVQRYVVPGSVLALSLSGSRAFAAASGIGGLYFFDEPASSSTYAWVFQNYTSFPQIAISRDASYVVAGGVDGYVYLLNRSGQLTGRERLNGSISTLSLSSATRRLLAGTTNGNTTLYAVEDGLKGLSSLAGRRPVTSAFVSENGERVSIANLDGVISVFNRSLTAQLWTFSAGAIVHSLSMSSNGRVVAASSDNGNIYLFDEEAHKTTNETSVIIVIVPVIVVGLLSSYLFWRRRTGSDAGKAYDHHKTSQNTEG